MVHLCLETSPLAPSYIASVVAQVFRRAQQTLHSENSEVLYDSTAETEPRIFVWDSDQLLIYVDGLGTSRPDESSAPRTKPMTDMMALGSVVNSPQGAWRTLSHRMRSAWKY